MYNLPTIAPCNRVHLGKLYSYGPLVEMDKAALNSSDYGLGAVTHSHLFEDFVKMRFDGSFGNEELAAYLPITLARHQACQYFHFAGGEIR
ncbi:MAG: hypothetical protein JWN14_1116, partial [Chthonomonadales bacterium]|nr:hypothetical protein [Chthonomonadales bacterium]